MQYERISPYCTAGLHVTMLYFETMAQATTKLLDIAGIVAINLLQLPASTVFHHNLVRFQQAMNLVPGVCGVKTLPQ